MVWAAIADAIGAATRQPFHLAGHDACGGGCINQSYRIGGQDGRRYFVKLNAPHQLPPPSTSLRTGFAAEAAGLEAIAATHTIRVPQPVVHGATGAYSFLVLEYLELRPHGNAALLGRQLAALHRVRAERFGWQQDNYIGATPQPNGWSDGWLEFWRERRLRFQFDLAARNGHGGKLQSLGAQLLDALPELLAGHVPQPSLLHGDLWGGNHAYLADGSPVIFDPAPYYGDRECDLAMTELFGGYAADFYAAYRADYPPEPGYMRRKMLYNLYHILNHVNLFGGGYLHQAERMMQQLLAETC